MEQASITVSRLVHDEIEQAQALVKHMDLPPVSLKEKPTLPRATSYGPVFGSAGHYVLGHASWIDDIVKVSAKAVSIFALDPGQEPEVCAVAQLLYKSQPARNARGTEHHRELPVLG
ncbi:MAG: hypothetical protein Q3976_06355 [Corynebacterium sp.]|nr:hypothetical protein [Corynebacterium sp.]